MFNKRITTINKRSDFIYLKKHGERIRMGLLNIIYAKLPVEQNNTRVAYIASKKVVGNAVKRNKVKRRLRSLVREYYNVVPNNYLLLFISSSKTYNIKYSLLKNDFLQGLKKIT